MKSSIRMTLCKKTCWSRIRKELAWQSMWLEEQNPSQFATSAWLRIQYPFLVYRIVCFIYSASILFWNCYQKSNPSSEVLPEEWFLSYPAWSFMILTLYCTLAFLLTALNFDKDCLCNDELAWYHKLCWVFHVVSFNGAVSCLFGTIVYMIGKSTNNSDIVTYTEVFESDDINFYIIGAIVMMIDVFIHDIPVRLLHFIYPGVFFIFYSMIHVYRWAAGYIPTATIFSFGSISIVMPTLFILFVTFIYIPVVHQIAFGIDHLRKRLLIAMWTRSNGERNQTGHSTFRNMSVGRATVQMSDSSISNSSMHSDRSEKDTVELEIFYDGYTQKL